MQLRLLRSVAESIKLLNEITCRKICVELGELLILRPDVPKTSNGSNAYILCTEFRSINEKQNF